MNAKDEDSRLYSSAGFASKMPTRAERKRAQASTGRTKSSKKSPYAGNLDPKTSACDEGEDAPRISARIHLGVDNLRDAIPAPAHTGPLAAVSRSRGAHVKASK